MKGKIFKIKNMDDELVLPITTTEAVYSEDGKTLNDEINDINSSLDNMEDEVDDINSSLDNKASKLNNINFVNVVEYGLNNNGEDCTLILKELLNKYDKLYFPNGTYCISNVIEIKNKVVIGESNTIIKTIDQKDASEWTLLFSGKNIVENIKFLQDHNNSLLSLKNCTNNIFRNCSFTVNNKFTNGYVDLYTNNNNITFDNCYFKCESTTVGGIWVREVESSKKTEFIYFKNCVIEHSSQDECLAIFNWNGKVENVFISNCVFTELSTSIAPHFISLDTHNIFMNNCNITRNYSNGNSVIKSEVGKAIVSNTHIKANSFCDNGIINGYMILDNCIIENSVRCMLCIRSNPIIKNSKIIVDSLQQTRNIELINTTITQTNNDKPSEGMFMCPVKLRGVIFDGVYANFLVRSYSADDSGLIIIENCKTLRNCSINFIVKGEYNSTCKIAITNSTLTGQLENLENSSGYVINNIFNYSTINSYDGIKNLNNILSTKSEE